MQIKCEYCGGFLDDTQETCPNCGATNANLKRTNNVTPRTIAELKAYCDQNGFDAQRTRFFVGEDYRGARAFGIYQDPMSGNFVVYKNKADGSRAVRYEGTDEAYAVNELYMRLQEEILNQKSHHLQNRQNAMRSAGSGRSGGSGRNGRNPLIVAVVTIFIIIMAVSILANSGIRKNGYYAYGGNTYYRLSNTWYEWSDYSNEWETSYSVPGELTDSWEEYRIDSEPYGVEDFTDTDFYSDWEDSRSYSDDDDYDYDYDSDWGSSDWDSGSTDWGSDW